MSQRKFILRTLQRIQTAATTGPDTSAVSSELLAMEAEFMTPGERHAFEMIVDILAITQRLSWYRLNRCFRSHEEHCDPSAMSYEQYLQTEHWKLIRQQKLIQADYRCQICNSADAPQAHHRTYERIGHEDLADLTVLCGDCHAKFHDKIPTQVREVTA